MVDVRGGVTGRELGQHTKGKETEIQKESGKGIERVCAVGDVDRGQEILFVMGLCQKFSNYGALLAHHFPPSLPIDR